MQTTLNQLAPDGDAVEVATIASRVLASNVVTINTVAAHGLAVGDRVVIAGLGSPFDGTYAVATVVDADSFTYAKTNANVASASATGTVSYVPEWTSLGINGRRGQQVLLRNLGPGDISYDFTEPGLHENVADVGFLLASGGQQDLTFEGTLYVSSDADDTDLRYLVVP